MAKVVLGNVHEYWPKYWRRSLSLLIGMQIIAVLVVGLALIITNLVDFTSIGFWIALGAVLLATVGVNTIVLAIVTEPLKLITATVAHKLGERTILTPPNPNVTRYEKNGLKPMLEAIYSFNSDAPEQPAQTTKSSTTDMSKIIESAPFGLALFNAEHQLTYHNTNVPLHVEPDGHESISLFFATETTFDQWMQECDEKAVHAEKTWNYIASTPLGQEDRKIYDVIGSYEKGSAWPFLFTFIDKTSSYAPEDEALNFTAFAAHELRGPITVIRGYLETLSDELAPGLDAEQKELFSRLTVSANRLSGYVNNILNASRYDRRHLSLHLAETTVAALYREIANDMQLRASSQRRILQVTIPADLPTVAADSATIGEVLSNLIDNAIKYSNEGGIVEVAAEQQDNFVEVFVRDHGIGMPANVVSNLFHKFYRSHRSREAIAGTGIGLYISKAIVESHGGIMEVRSVEGEGSTFSFTLPVFASVASKLNLSGGDNKDLITKTGSGSWIKNHGAFRG